MTDSQTPATEAGRRLLVASHHGAALELGDIIAIEAEARGDLQTQLDEAYERLADEGYKDGIRLAEAVNEVVGHRVAEARASRDMDTAYEAGREDGRADALREAAERVRALPDGSWKIAILAILDPQ